MSLPVGYEYRDVTACGLRIQRRHCLWVTNTETYRDVTACGLRIQRCHCLWVTNTETTLPVGYEYRDVTACGLRIQRRHCLCVLHTDVTASFFLFWLWFWNGRKRRSAGKWPMGNNSPAFKRVLNVMTCPPWIVLAAARRLFLQNSNIVFW